MRKFSFVKSAPENSIFRWFLCGFSSMSIIFLIALIPLILYCRGVFLDLELKKITQQLDSGISQFDGVFSTIANASDAMFYDARFYSTHSTNSDYSNISPVTQNQMRDYLKHLLLPCPSILDSALQLSEREAVTSTVATLNNWTGYYPFYFQVNDLPFDEWEQLLQDNKTGYLPVCRVTTPYRSYDALIYSIQWSPSKYFYACQDISTIRGMVIAEQNLSHYHLTIEDIDGTCLYSEIVDSNIEYYSVSQDTNSGGLTFTVHVPKSMLASQMKPLYAFLIAYLLIYLSILACCIFLGTHLTTIPLRRIIYSLGAHKDSAQESKKYSKDLGGYGFHFIHGQILSYQSDLQKYQATIETQKKVLQARYMEKAIHGFLSTEDEINAFFSQFPGFPTNYRLILLGLIEQNIENGNIYPNAMAMIQCYLHQISEQIYLQQLTSHTLLIIIDENDYSVFCRYTNQLIDNINREEPCYHAWGIISKQHHDPKDIPFAYSQIQELSHNIFTESLYGLCTVSDMKVSRNTRFQMSDATVIYSAIANGNLDLSNFYLRNYAEHINNHSVYEMFYSILLCVKQEYAALLMDVKIPAFRPQTDLYPVLAECISTICQILHAEKEANTGTFANQVKDYIDTHFTEESLCSTVLEEQFHCSFVKIRKQFSKEFGTSISAYIESKRLALANELLLKGKHSVTEIYQKCGYSNYNTFLKAYRRIYGSTPSSARKE